MYGDRWTTQANGITNLKVNGTKEVKAVAGDVRLKGMSSRCIMSIISAANSSTEHLFSSIFGLFKVET
jgi:hypothetical protein